MRLWLSIFFLAYVALYAFRSGGKPEKYVAAAFTISFAGELLAVQLFGLIDFRSFDPLRVTLDGGVFVCLLVVALRANRWWPIWTAGLQLIVVTGHVSAFLKTHAIAGVYWGMTVLPYYPEYLCLLLGTVWHSRRVTKYGSYPDWSLATT